MTTARRPRLFLLSPAHCGGKRAQVLMNPAAGFDLACRLRSDSGAPLGEVFSFLSGLYFRGKMAYARSFAHGPDLIRVITTNCGLLSPDVLISREELSAFGTTDIANGDDSFRLPMIRDCDELKQRLGPVEVVLLGSVATSKYTELLLNAFDERLVFPTEFVGRGDMSRGALMLRSAASGEELAYTSVRGAIVRGTRAPKVADMVTNPARSSRRASA